MILIVKKWEKNKTSGAVASVSRSLVFINQTLDAAAHVVGNRPGRTRAIRRENILMPPLVAPALL